MNPPYDTGAGKRPVNLTLNEDLVKQARSLTPNLSAVVETLLADYVVRERHEQLQRARVLERAVDSWNQFNAASGSIADEYSSL
ncbi:MAG: type II toxin-antitoxin system CcdA family antitoxin [Steroidobacteraceae bacterium]